MDILKFPSTIRIPDNIRFIGAINVDETTHYFSPKIIDRVHVIKFDNPLLYEEQVNSWFENKENEKELNPVYVNPNLFSTRNEYPSLRKKELSFIENELKNINQTFLIPMKIDFGIRSIRQGLNYYLIEESYLNKNIESFNGSEEEILGMEILQTDEIELNSINTIIIQKIFPRFIFDGNDITSSGKSKLEVTKEFCDYLKQNLTNISRLSNDGSDWEIEEKIEVDAFSILFEMIKQAERNNSQFNFFA